MSYVSPVVHFVWKIRSELPLRGRHKEHEFLQEGTKPRDINSNAQSMETADLLGTTRWTGARKDEIADDDRKLLSTGSRVQ
jgi:hypothetical protein